MHYSVSLSAVALFAASAAAQRSCGNVNVPQGLKNEAASMQKGVPRGSFKESMMAKRTQVVKAYFHNVYVNRTEAGGYLTREQLQSQAKAMSDQYASTGISFDLKRITHTMNPEWATFSVDNDVNGTELTMKKALRKGDYQDLNVYFRILGDGLLGICEFPNDVQAGSDEFYIDGCQVLYSSIPGGSTTNYDEGKTATHEVGHWFGLFHTFQDGCSNDGGDMVSDTPAEREPTSGCPATKDTCTGTQFPGADPIHNYMDYSYDSCMNQFTTGQATRIYQMWDRFRANGPKAPTS